MKSPFRLSIAPDPNWGSPMTGAGGIFQQLLNYVSQQRGYSPYGQGRPNPYNDLNMFQQQGGDDYYDNGYDDDYYDDDYDDDYYYDDDD